MKALLENKKEIILSNIGYKEFNNKCKAMKKANEIRKQYKINVYPKRVTRIKTQAKKNIIKTIYKEVYILC